MFVVYNNLKHFNNMEDIHCCGVRYDSVFSLIDVYRYLGEIRGDADKSLARPGRKQAIATRLGIYSTYSPRSSIHFLARCSNFYKPLKKKIQKVVRPTRAPRLQ